LDIFSVLDIYVETIKRGSLIEIQELTLRTVHIAYITYAEEEDEVAARARNPLGLGFRRPLSKGK
jgi:hypothetical protein